MGTEYVLLRRGLQSHRGSELHGTGSIIRERDHVDRHLPVRNREPDSVAENATRAIEARWAVQGEHSMAPARCTPSSSR